MPLIEMDRGEMETFLAGRRVVRICFQSRGERYIVPLGYSWLDGALCGAMTEGRKTRLADADPRVAFQVDDTPDAGPWEWTSVSGEGWVEWVDDPAEARRIEEAQARRWADMPSWLRRELEAVAEAGRTRRFRLVLSGMTGVRSRPAEG